jgi:hypothetical protein
MKKLSLLTVLEGHIRKLYHYIINKKRIKSKTIIREP